MEKDHLIQSFYLFNRKLHSLLNKTLRGMRTRAKWIFVAKATALGARVPQAELFGLSAASRSPGLPESWRALTVR